LKQINSDKRLSNNPLVSIVIATYNRADLLPETLDSVLRQNYHHWECIIIDDGSNDQTGDVVQKYLRNEPRFRFYRRTNQYKKGPAGCFNYGLDLSTGELIQWFGSDDIMSEIMLSEIVKGFLDHPAVQSVYSNMYFFEEKPELITGQTKINKRLNEFYENTITWSIPVWSLNFMFRTEFLKKVNIRFDESLERLIDYDFHSRLFIKYPHEVYILDKPLSYVRRKNNSITTSYFSKEREVELQLSEYIVANKIIRLLIDENKLTDDLEHFFYRDHKRRISKLIKASDKDTVKLFEELVALYLTHNKKSTKLFRFRAGLSLLKKFRLDNFFLIYNLPAVPAFIIKYTRHIVRSIFIRGYLVEKLNKKGYNFR